MTHSLSVIIVNWNGKNFLPECLKSLIDYPPGIPYEIVVVDNSSTDGSSEWLRSIERQELTGSVKFVLIESGENIGFGRANNLAIERSDADRILLLNPDTIVQPGSIDVLLAAIDDDEKTGAVAPKLLNSDGSLQASVHHYPPTFGRTLAQYSRIYRLMPERIRARYMLSLHWDHNEVITAPVVWGAAMLFKADLLKALGGFDPEIFMYGEDYDLCIRLRKLGYELRFIPAAEIIHLGGQSVAQKWDEKESSLQHEEMSVLLEKRYMSRTQFYMNSLLILSAESVRILLYRLTGRSTVHLQKMISIRASGLRKK